MLRIRESTSLPSLAYILPQHFGLISWRQQEISLLKAITIIVPLIYLSDMSETLGKVPTHGPRSAAWDRLAPYDVGPFNPQIPCLGQTNQGLGLAMLTAALT
jgi:hypothetical protein